MATKIKSMATRCGQILSLYKQLLREANKFPNYMYRTYSLRRIRDGFREHKGETDVQKISDLLKYATGNLEIIKRQVVIGQMFKGQDIIIEQYLKSDKASHGV